MPQTIPLQATPSQTLSVTLSGQAAQLNIYQKRSGLYMDVFVNNTMIIGGVICENLNRIIRSLYLGFAGDFMFLDNEGQNDPDYTGLGSRYTLSYLLPSELPDGQG